MENSKTGSCGETKSGQSTGEAGSNSDGALRPEDNEVPIDKDEAKLAQ